MMRDSMNVQRASGGFILAVPSVFTFGTVKNNIVEMGHCGGWQKPCIAKATAHSVMAGMMLVFKRLHLQLFNNAGTSIASMNAIAASSIR